MSPGRPAWGEFRAALDAVGFRPSKTLGQNFLLDGNMARSIARDAGVGTGDRVLELGSGCGFLTAHLAELGCELTAIELDRRLFAVASDFLGTRANVRLVRGDALAGKHALGAVVLAAVPQSGHWHLVANLPYAISAPLLALLARLPNPPESMSALVQREVAERVAAEPGSADWGALPAKLALLYRRRVGRAVAAHLFWPRPRVESRVVHLERLAQAVPDPGELAAYDALVEGLFRCRRKQLQVGLGALLGDRQVARETLVAAGIDPSARPAALALGPLRALAASRAWRKRP